MNRLTPSVMGLDSNSTVQGKALNHHKHTIKQKNKTKQKQRNLIIIKTLTSAQNKLAVSCLIKICKVNLRKTILAFWLFN